MVMTIKVINNHHHHHHYHNIIFLSSVRRTWLHRQFCLNDEHVMNTMRNNQSSHNEKGGGLRITVVSVAPSGQM